MKVTSHKASSALIIVDMQYDFLPGGPLGVADGDSLIRPIVELAQNAYLVIASRDWHPVNHFSFNEDPQYVDGSWPPHCVQNTKGARIFPAIKKVSDYVVSKGMDRNTEAYSVFAGKTLRPVETLRDILDRSPIDQIIVCGLVFEVCVRYTALDANALGYRTIVPLNATRSLGPGFDHDTLNQFNRAGVEVVDHL